MIALLVVLAAGSAEVPFEPSAKSFADAAGCRGHLSAWVLEARRAGAEAAVGPYEIGAGDVRAHNVAISGSGHRITEQRCTGEKLSSRTWRRSMEETEAEAPDTIEDMAAKAEWLKKLPRN
jgi:hypothetical protein